MSEGHPEFMRLLDEIRAMHLAKTADYGTSEDPFANLRSAAEFGVPPWIAAVLRANDKMHRIKAMIANGSLKNESIEDSLLDIASYMPIALILYRESQGEQLFGIAE